MASKACPACGLKNPARAIHCDCGHEFSASSASQQPRTCSQCARVWPAATPLCRCGQWLDEDARLACQLYEARRAKGLVLIVSGVVTCGLAMVLPFSIVWMFGGGGMIVKGAHSVTFAVNGLRSYERPTHDPAPKTPS